MMGAVLPGGLPRHLIIHPVHLPAMHRLPILLFVTLAATLSGAGGLFAQEASPVAEYRQGLMSSLASHFGGLRTLASGDVAEPEHVVLHARALADAGEMLQVVWAEGSAGEGSRARPEIWADWDDFQGRLEALRAATARVRDRAEAGDMQGFGAALQELGPSCRGCHTDYRAPANQ
jgi:cytochrome c556